VATNFFRKRSITAGERKQLERENNGRPTSNSFLSLAKDMCEKQFIQFIKMVIIIVIHKNDWKCSNP